MADEALLGRPPAAHLLLCGLVSNRPLTGQVHGPEGWGPLRYRL